MTPGIIFFHRIIFKSHAIAGWEESRNIIYRDIYMVTYYYYINDTKSVIVRLIQTVESTLINRSKKWVWKLISWSKLNKKIITIIFNYPNCIDNVTSLNWICIHHLSMSIDYFVINNTIHSFVKIDILWLPVLNRTIHKCFPVQSVWK